jgi:hypothetical protein
VSESFCHNIIVLMKDVATKPLLPCLCSIICNLSVSGVFLFFFLKTLALHRKFLVGDGILPVLLRQLFYKDNDVQVEASAALYNFSLDRMFTQSRFIIGR